MLLCASWNRSVWKAVSVIIAVVPWKAIKSVFKNKTSGKKKRVMFSLMYMVQYKCEAFLIVWLFRQ